MKQQDVEDRWVGKLQVMLTTLQDYYKVHLYCCKIYHSILLAKRCNWEISIYIKYTQTWKNILNICGSGNKGTLRNTGGTCILTEWELTGLTVLMWIIILHLICRGQVDKFIFLSNLVKTKTDSWSCHPNPTSKADSATVFKEIWTHFLHLLKIPLNTT